MTASIQTLGIFKGLRNCALLDCTRFRGQSCGLNLRVLSMGQPATEEVQRVKTTSSWNLAKRSPASLHWRSRYPGGIIWELFDGSLNVQPCRFLRSRSSLRRALPRRNDGSCASCARELLDTGRNFRLWRQRRPELRYLRQFS